MISTCIHFYSFDFFTINLMNKSQTSSDGESSELVLSYRKPGVVVCRDPQVVPLCRIQVQHHKVSSWLHIVRNLVPFCLRPINPIDIN